jgi:hypothetical protein
VGVDPTPPPPSGRNGWGTWPGWLVAYLITLVVIRDIVLTLWAD